MREPLRRSDFFEAADGNCRLSTSLCSRLSETAPTWGKLVAPWAEYVAHSLRAHHASRPNVTRGLSTPLTQTHRRKAKSASPPDIKMPKVESVCSGCGTPTRAGRNCPKCGREISRSKLVELSKLGRVVALRPESRKKRAESQRRHWAARQGWLLASKPEWLTEAKYRSEIQPRLVSIAISQLASALGVSEPYAADIRAGRYCPHPRHWKALADLAGVRE
jgi:ribosomal protein L32